MSPQSPQFVLADVEKAWNDFEKYLIEERYALREDGRPIESTYDHVISRVILWATSSAVSQVHVSIRNFFTPEILSSIARNLDGQYVVPASPVLMNAGSTSKHPGFFSCFPLGYVGDSLSEIMETANTMAHIYKRAGGCGVNMSKIRAKGTPVDNGQGYASGPVSFMQIFDAVAGTISQGGKRRGALMCNLSDSHPDWEEFVFSKGSGKYAFKNMNISLDIEGKIKKEMLDKIAENIHKCGDPGLIFVENAYANTPIPLELEPRQVNPCAEYMSVANTACNLISINLPAIAKAHTDDISLFMLKIFDVAYDACLFGNIMIWQNEGYPIEAIRQKTQELRPVGIGMLGLHGAMIRFGIDYESKAALQFARQIQAHIALGSMKASANLRMYAESNWKPGVRQPRKAEFVSVYTPSVPCRTEWMTEHVIKCSQNTESIMVRTSVDTILQCLQNHGSLYNMVTTVQAPTGSISQLVHSASNGIEPLFSIETQRSVTDVNKGKVNVVLVPEELFDSSGKLVVDLKKLEKNVSHNISPKFQIDIMATIQDLCHTAISKTINVPESCTVDEIKEIIQYAFDSKLKAITVFRDSSKSEQVLTRKKEEKKVELEKPKPKDTSHRRLGETWTLRGTKSCHVIMNYNGVELCELFLVNGKSGTTVNAMGEALGRVISIILTEHPEMKDQLAETLGGIDSGTIYSIPGHRFRSIPDALSYLLKNAKGVIEADIKEADKVIEQKEESKGVFDTCPKCDRLSLRRYGNCLQCNECGHSSC